jgi:hypothetical protein
VQQFVKHCRIFSRRPPQLSGINSDVKQMIARQLDNAEDRFAAICHDDA